MHTHPQQRCSKVLWLHLYLQMSNEWNINFLQNCPLDIQHVYSSKFSLVKSPLKIFFSYAIKLCHWICFNFFVYILKSNTFEINFSIRKEKTHAQILREWNMLHLHNPVFCKHQLFRKSWNRLHNLFHIVTNSSKQVITSTV